MTVCRFCNHKNDADARHCSQCGAVLEQVDENPYAFDEPKAEEKTEGRAEATSSLDEVDDPLDREILELFRTRGKIAAIKRHREATGTGLKESKEYVEALARKTGIVAPAGGCSSMILLALSTLSLLAWFIPRIV